jgi:hypothetical protein
MTIQISTKLVEAIISGFEALFARLAIKSPSL